MQKKNLLNKLKNVGYVALIAFIMFIMLRLMFQHPPSTDTRTYEEITHVTFFYADNDGQTVYIQANPAAQKKLNQSQMVQLSQQANKSCNKLLGEEQSIQRVSYDQVFISIYDGSPYVHLDITLKAFDNSYDPKNKKFHQTFNVTPDSIAIIETKFLY